MNTTTIIVNARLRELITLVLHWYLFKNEKKLNDFHASVVRLFVYPVTYKHIKLSTKQAFYLRTVLIEYKNSLMRTFSTRDLVGRRFALICVEDLLRQLEYIQKDYSRLDSMSNRLLQQS